MNFQTSQIQDTVSAPMGGEENRNCYTLSEYIRQDNIGRARHPNFLNTFESSLIPSLQKQSREVTYLSCDANKIRRIEIGPGGGYRGSGVDGHHVSGTHTRISRRLSRSPKSGRYPGNFCDAPVDRRHTLSFLARLKNRRTENTRIPGNLRFK